jgi:DNA polymerase-1
MEQLFLIDGHAICYRAFYAIRELRNSHGQPTNAVFGFVQMIRKIINDYHPERMIVCFDAKGQTYRQQKYTDYKIQRPDMPDDLVSQIPLIHAVLDGYQIHHYDVEGYEADDLIGSIVQKYKDRYTITIVSDDKDLYQLAGDTVQFYSPRQQAIRTWDDVLAKFDFDPRFVADFLALAGDSSDNIPGVPGVGKVTATKLIKAYGSVESMYEQLDTITPEKIREKLRMHEDSARISKELALLVLDAPVPEDDNLMIVGEPRRDVLFSLFSQLEFTRLTSEFAESVRNRALVKIYDQQEDPKPWSQLLSDLPGLQSIALGVETTDEQLRVYVSANDHSVHIVQPDALENCLERLIPLDVRLIVYDLKGWIHRFPVLKRFPLDRCVDVLLAAYVINPSESRWDLDTLLMRYLNIVVGQDALVSESTVLLPQLSAVLEQELKDLDQLKLFHELEMPLAVVLADIESHGVHLDTDLLSLLSTRCAGEIESLTDQLYRLAGHEFNINSPKQLSQVLFEELKLPVVKKTKTGFSTDEQVLSTLSQDHEFPKLILKYRQLAKLKSTYIDALPKMIDPVTQRIHTEFLQYGTETGRLSSRHPNLQNIPVRTEMGRQIRQAFNVSSDECVMLALDYSQIELRIMAHLSNDARLVEAFVTGQDIHNYTASLIFEVAENAITPEMRYATKRVNFGIIYGISAFGLSKDLNCSAAEAQSFIDTYFERYPGVKAFMDQCIEQCRELGYVETILKRRRYIPDIHHKNAGIRQFAERQAINTPVQGSAADLMKLAMNRIHQHLGERYPECLMILTVHDELIFECPRGIVEPVLALVKADMEEAISLNVPVCVSMKSGRNWLELEEVAVTL